MHFEFLVEDRSGYEMVEYLIPKIIGTNSTNTFKIHPYKGCGSLPKGLKANQAAEKRALFNQLPRLLKGYSLAFKNCLDDNAVIVVCDLDDKDKNTFISELNKKRDDVLALSGCSLNVFFCLAIEEGESWLLGDWDAIKKAYPRAKINVFRKYINDSICGTWEILADVVYPGGSKNLKKQGHGAEGTAKSEWAKKISPHMNVFCNKSPSFNYFKDTLDRLKG